MLKNMELILASNNPHKAREFGRLLKGHTINLPGDKGIQFTYDEKGADFLENAFGKAKELYSHTRKPVIADDSGLCVEALDGRPGIYSARYGSDIYGKELSLGDKELSLGDKELSLGDKELSLGDKELSLGDKEFSPGERNTLLLSEMKNITRRQAFFVCCIVLIIDTYRFFIAQETLCGEIAEQSSGTGGFGYDPVFFIPSLKKTVAELDDHEKDNISHRGKAARQIMKFLQS